MCFFLGGGGRWQQKHVSQITWRHMPKNYNLVIHIFVMKLRAEGFNWEVIWVDHLQSRASAHEHNYYYDNYE